MESNVLTYDFCPWANRYVYWLKQPLALLILAAIGSLSIGLFVAPQGLWACGGVTALVALGIVWPWLGMQGLTASLAFTRRKAHEGEEVEAILRVVNRWPFPVWGLTLAKGFNREADPSGVIHDSVAVALSRIPAWSQAEFRWAFAPSHRGEYPIDPPELRTAFPFGLYTSARKIAVQATLLVWPRTVNLEALPQHTGTSLRLGALSDLRGGYQGDVIGTRPFRPGDSMRHVHWPLTARYGRFIVSERQAAQTTTALVNVDLRPEVHGGVGSSSSLESAIRIAASVVECLLLHHQPTQLVINGRTAAMATDARSLPGIFDLLARWQPANEVAEEWHPTVVFTCEVAITTELAMQRQRPRQPALHIVLSASAFAGLPACDVRPENADIWLVHSGRPLRDFQIQWERSSRHAWQTAG